MNKKRCPWCSLSRSGNEKTKNVLARRAKDNTPPRGKKATERTVTEGTAGTMQEPVQYRGRKGGRRGEGGGGGEEEIIGP